MSLFLRRAAIAPHTVLPPQSILRLPPTLRLSLYGQQSRPFSLLDGAVFLPHTLLTTLHATGLPWATVIPISAIVIRVFITFAISLPARHATRKQMQLLPLQSAYRRATFINASKALGNAGLVSPKATKEMEARVKKVSDEVDRLIERTWLSPGIRFWTWYPLLQLPVFLSVMEAVRSMIGMQQGLLGAAIGILRGKAPGTTETAQIQTIDAPVETEAIEIPTIYQIVSPDLSAIPSPSATDAPTLYHAEWFEPTMTTEGLPWMLDLTIADPTPFPLTMSFVVSGFMLGNILLSGPKKTPGMVISPFRRGLSRFLILFALGMGPLTLHLPSGLVYYWACSSASGLAANLWLDWRYPLKASVKACKRPLRKTA